MFTRFFTQEKFSTFLRVFEWFKNRPWVVFIVLIAATYWQIPFTFFEQDEWIFFGEHITGHRSNNSHFWFLPVQRAMTGILLWLEWHIFGMNAYLYGLFSIALAMLTGFALYRVLRHWQIESWCAVAAAGLALIFANGSHTISWFGSFTAALPSAITALFALDLFMTALKEPKFRYYWLIPLLCVMSLYFKEESLWLLPLLPMTWVLHSLWLGKRVDIKLGFKLLSPIAAVYAFYFIAERVRQIYSPSFSSLISSTEPTHYIKDVIEAVFLLPLAHLPKTLVAHSHFIQLAQNLQLKTTLLAYAISIIGLLLIAVAIWRTKDAKYRLLTIWLTVWCLVSFLAFAVFGKNPEFLELRYYFPAQLPLASLLVVMLLPYRGSKRLLPLLIGGIILLVIACVNISATWARLSGSMNIGQERLNIINTIKRHIGSLDPRSMILIEAKDIGYNGSPVPIIPFQSGVGYAMLVTFHGNQQDFRPFILNQFLWDWLSQGYKEMNGIGFGYYWDYGALVRDVATHAIDPADIHSFYYEDKQLKDTSDVIRRRIIGQKLIYSSLDKKDWKISSNYPQGAVEGQGVLNAIDNNLQSTWAATFTEGQYFELDLGRSFGRVGKMSLDFADQYQYSRKYKVEISDGTTWKTVTEDVGRPEGLVQNIYFEPQNVRSIRYTNYDTLTASYNRTINDIQVYQTR